MCIAGRWMRGRTIVEHRSDIGQYQHPPLCDIGAIPSDHVYCAGWFLPSQVVRVMVVSDSVGVLGWCVEPEATTRGKERSDAAGRFPCPRDVTGGAYLVSVLPSVGRAAIVRAPEFSPQGHSWYALGETEVLVDDWGEVFAERARLPDLERSRRSLERSARRARRAIEDYMVHNCLSKMWTLTYREKCWSRAQAVADIHEFVKQWRAYMGRAFPYVWVLEKHKDGSWHVHVAVHAGLYTDKATLQKMWGHGLVQFDLPKTVNPGRRDMRRLSRYLSKYISKDFGDDCDVGTHRYEVAQGYQPEKVSHRFETFGDALSYLLMFGAYQVVWDSQLDDQCTGPNVRVYESP